MAFEYVSPVRHAPVYTNTAFDNTARRTDGVVSITDSFGKNAVRVDYVLPHAFCAAGITDCKLLL